MKINLQTQKKKRKTLVLRDIPVVENGVVVSTKRIDIQDSMLMVYVNDSDTNLLKEGDAVSIERYKNGNIVCSADLHVISVINNIVSLDLPSSSGSFTIKSVSDFASGDTLYYMLTLDRPHNIIQDDIKFLRELPELPYISLIDSDNGIEVKVYDFFVINDSNDIGEEYNLYINVGELYEGDECAPATSGLCVPEEGMFITLNYSPYIYFKDEKYHLFGDEEDNTEIKFTVNNAFMTLQLGLSESTDYVTLRQHESVDEMYAKIRNNIIPGFIDMERTRYIPFLCSGDNLFGQAETIEFDLHFRTRVKKPNSYMPTSRWTIQTEENSPQVAENADFNYWNNFLNYGNIPNLGDNNNEYLLYQSDLVGNLGFTDDDVLNRRSKISKSFLRLSFYNSNNPLQSTLLFYSTIFMDAAELYSKYIKLKTDTSYPLWEDKFYKSDENGDGYDNDWGLVVFDGIYNNTQVVENDDLLTCKMKVSSEFDKLHSAEGYNLYLFADDAPGQNGEEESRTIYMKVEFNHAGYGRTVPLIIWPRNDNGEAVGLTRENYYQSLYIPVEVRYNKATREYVYYIQSAKNDIANNKIIFSLFEPKFEPSQIS